MYADVTLCLVRPNDPDAFILFQLVHVQVRNGGDTEPNALNVNLLGCLVHLAVHPTDLETVAMLWFPIVVIDRSAARGPALCHRISPLRI